MKLSKTARLVIAIGIFIVVAFGLNMVRSQQVDEQNQLNGKLDLARLNLQRASVEKLSSRQAKLESQLSQATSQIEAAKARLSQPMGSFAVSNILFDIAKAHGVEVIMMTSTGPTSGSLEEVTCSVISLTAEVEGDVPNLVNFVTNLNSHLATGVVNSITITIPEAASGEKASADIKLVVYTYQEG